MSQRTDPELVEAARGGDVHAFGELYERHYAGIVGVAYCVLGDRDLAEDAAQEAFAIACRDLRRLRNADRFAGWLSGICRNVAKSIARSRASNGKVLPAVAPDHTGTGVAEAVRRSVQRLPESARDVVILRYFSGLSHEQIADTLGISPPAVHGRLIRARRKMAEDLKRNGLET